MLFGLAGMLPHARKFLEVLLSSNTVLLEREQAAM